MKILLVEDNEAKAKEVNGVISTVCANGIACHRARSFVSAVRALGERDFDLLILDLVLPIRDNETPDNDGGRRVLSEIANGECGIPPMHIICLTEYPEVSAKMGAFLERSIAHTVVYSQTDSNWRESFKAKIEYVYGRLSDAAIAPNEHGFDLAIVTSSPKVELAQILRLPVVFAPEFCSVDSLYYYRSIWKRLDGRELSVVACAAPSMGMTAACVTACKVISRFRPRFIAMTGIAAGTTDKLNLGDIVAAETVYDYGSGKILDSENGERTFLPSPRQISLDTETHALLQKWEREQIATDDIRRAWQPVPPTPPKMHLGVIASGAAVVQSSQFVASIVDDSRKTVAIDMEAYAIFQAAALAAAPKPRPIVLKSVSDYADVKKSDDVQDYAAHTSARMLFELFTRATELAVS